MSRVGIAAAQDTCKELNTHWITWTSQKRMFTLKHELGCQGKGKSGSETDELCLNFRKKVRCKWYFFLCKYYEARVSKH